MILVIYVNQMGEKKYMTISINSMYWNKSGQHPDPASHSSGIFTGQTN